MFGSDFSWIVKVSMGYYARIIARMATTTMEALVLRAPLSFFSSFDTAPTRTRVRQSLGQGWGAVAAGPDSLTERRGRGGRGKAGVVRGQEILHGGALVAEVLDLEGGAAEIAVRLDFLKIANSYLVALGQSTGLSRIESDLANFAQVLLFSMSQISRPQG